MDFLALLEASYGQEDIPEFFYVPIESDALLDEGIPSGKYKSASSIFASKDAMVIMIRNNKWYDAYLEMPSQEFLGMNPKVTRIMYGNPDFFISNPRAMESVNSRNYNSVLMPLMLDTYAEVSREIYGMGSTDWPKPEDMVKAFKKGLDAHVNGNRFHSSIKFAAVTWEKVFKPIMDREFADAVGDAYYDKATSKNAFVARVQDFRGGIQHLVGRNHKEWVIKGTGGIEIPRGTTLYLPEYNDTHSLILAKIKGRGITIKKDFDLFASYKGYLDTPR